MSRTGVTSKVLSATVFALAGKCSALDFPYFQNRPTSAGTIEDETVEMYAHADKKYKGMRPVTSYNGALESSG